DDHTPLNAAGIPVIDLIDFDYPPWHTAEDTMDKLSAESLEIVGRVALYDLAQVELR
ncbi:MAG: aminopeptidase, partial [Chthoniobacterales bacterium]